MTRYLMLYIEHDGYNKITTEITDDIKTAVKWIRNEYDKIIVNGYDINGNVDTINPNDSEENLIYDLEFYEQEGFYVEMVQFEDFWVGYYVRKIEV